VATQEGSPPGENAAKSSDSGAANQNDPSKAAGQDASPAEHSEEKNKEK
jgi:hypothetical protein